jgi:hypothetical protein
MSLFSKWPLRSLVGCKCSKTDTVEHWLHQCKLVIVFPFRGETRPELESRSPFNSREPSRTQRDFELGLRRLLFLVLLNVVVNRVRKFQISIEIAAVRVFGIQEDGEFLLRLPLQDAFTAPPANLIPVNTEGSVLLGREVRFQMV